VNQANNIGAIVLAAGLSRRFGGAKQLAVLSGRTLLEHAVDAARGAGLDPVVAVVPIWLTRPAHMDEEWLRWVRNAHPEAGIGESLRIGLGALDGETEAAVILLGDQPLIDPRVIPALLSARGERPIVASEADGLLAPPLIIERAAFGLADGLVGEAGLRDTMRAHPDLVRPIHVERHAQDVDTTDDLTALDRP